MQTGIAAASVAAVSAADVSRYHADGFLIVRGVFAAEQVAELDADAQLILGRSDLIDPNNIRCRWQNHAETASTFFR